MAMSADDRMEFVEWIRRIEEKMRGLEGRVLELESEAEERRQARAVRRLVSNPSGEKHGEAVLYTR